MLVYLFVVAPRRARAALRGQLPRPPSWAGGRPTVRQFPTSPDPLSRGLIAMTGSEKASAKACLRRLRPPAFAGLRDHDRTIGLGRRFRPPAAPLHAPIEHRHPLTFYPDSERLKRSRPVFSYLPEGLSMLRCAAARLGRLQSLPVRPDPYTCMATPLESNPCRYDKAPMARAIGNRVEGICLIRAPS